MELFFDCETSGFINKNLGAKDPKQAWIVQLAFILSDKDRIFTEFSSLIIAKDRTCHPAAQAIHQISMGDCNKGGISETNIINSVIHGFFTADTLVAHNYSFDIEFIDQLIYRSNVKWRGLKDIPYFCTMKETTDLCKLPGRFGKFKWPKLTELYKFLFNEEMKGAHDALADVRATRRCYYRLMKGEL